MQLYRREEKESLPQSPAPTLQLYRRGDSRETIHDATNEVVVADGWEDDDLLVDDEEASVCSGAANPEPPKALAGGDPYGFVTADWTYDPVTDIRPTRKRWINPIPGPRRLVP